MSHLNVDGLLICQASVGMGGEAEGVVRVELGKLQTL